MIEQNLESFLIEKKEVIDRLLPTQINILEAPSILKESMLYSLSAGGKRIRPILLLSVLEGFGKSDDAGLELACAIELIHTYSLIHDDLPAMDDDDFRRGKLTNHKVHGEAMAILAGDGLLTYSFQMVAAIRHPDVTDGMKVKLIEKLAKAAGPEGMVGGQVADMDGEGKELTVANLEYIHHHKTGDLLTYSIVAGAIIAGANKQDIAYLERFAYELGLVFQIKDDILDIEGDAAELGKPVGSDVSSMKSTYPRLLTLDGAKQKLNEHTKLAKEYLYKVGMNHSLLEDITDFIVNRTH